MAQKEQLKGPFLRSGMDVRGMMWAMMSCLILTAAHFSLRYDGAYFPRFLLVVFLGWAMEWLYGLLCDGRSVWPRVSTGVTGALLALSVPAHMPLLPLLCGLLVAVWFGKCIVDRSALRVNPMILGRLFLMLVFAAPIQEWLAPGREISAITSATPLGLYKAEGITYGLGKLITGSIQGDWEGVYEMLPGAPGEVMPLLALFFGVILYWMGVLDWRPGVAFMGSFAIACAFLKMPILFHAAAGSVIFTSVYVITDPRSTPGSKAGRWMAGAVAGAITAAVRWHGYYPEGVVFGVLAANLLAPTLDRLAFALRGIFPIIGKKFRPFSNRWKLLS
ncbi:MAG: RnfABCDGE type electron transport complex subunit D [Kiritimatiellae bacterium]|nr:RnfABCDGE type electron transport complex subunit D [Kiritimatiellia bacterium]